jgi:hypothetical protein
MNKNFNLQIKDLLFNHSGVNIIQLIFSHIQHAVIWVYPRKGLLPAGNTQSKMR